jgi:ribosome-binding protein aMBF1 (putative translation factor)
MECELCGINNSTQFKPTDWGERHVCDDCAPQVQLSIPRESPEESETVEEDRFKTAAERFLRDLGVNPRSGKRPPNNPR